MKLAYIILCHQWTDQLARLVKRLTDEDQSVLVHVNKRSSKTTYQRIKSELEERLFTFPKRV